eukprot:TRINITY_DN17029_c0_g1_i1.p1 TRINITY_DN17029_c0_g1~~TRINITY_DN17029_c0_g1_i1.p1  ORF type:complete len:158 (-),score=46.84 TRINITY_DN17029_c0_g1_i1:65-538(-)
MQKERSNSKEKVFNNSGFEGASKLEADLKAHPHLKHFAIYDKAGKIVFSSSAFVSEAEIREFLEVFSHTEEVAYRDGVAFNGKQFDIHRFNPNENLIYGRTTKGDTEASEGFVIHRTNAEGKEPVYYTLASWGYPTLSARAVPEVMNLDKKHVTPLL